PSGFVAHPVPDPDAVELMGRRCDATVVEHRVNEQLAFELWPEPITSRQHHPGGQSSSGAGSGDDESGRIDAEGIALSAVHRSEAYMSSRAYGSWNSGARRYSGQM